MSFSHLQDENIENENTKNEDIEKCRSDLSFFKQIAFEKCRMTPSLAAGPGNIYRLLHGRSECEKASNNFINQLEACHNLPKFRFK
jgi:hypothetical protein